MNLNKHIIFLILLPLILWGIFLTFEDALTPKPKPVKKPAAVKGDIVTKYSVLEKELNGFSMQKPDPSVLEKIIQIKKLPPPPPPPPPPPAKPKKTLKKPIQRNWELKYIIITDSKKIAFLNGKIVKVGDFVNGARVIDIKPNCVKIKDKGIKCIYLNH